VTIREVARRAGVAVSTASLALNGKPRVSAELAGRVLQAARELGYRPNTVAQSLKTRRTNLVSLIVADITNPFFSAMARGAEDFLGQHGYSLIICNTDEDPVKEGGFLEISLRKKVDGVLLVPTGEDHAGIQALAGSACPVVLVDRLAPGVNADVVLSDNVGGTCAGTDYLIRAGHRRVGIIAGRLAVSAIRERLAGYEQALAVHGIAADPGLIVSGGHTVHGGYAACLDLLKRKPRPTAVFATNNLMLRGALMALREMGLSWPEDVSLLGFDDFDEAALLSPPISVVAQRPYEMGQRAGELLLDRLAGSSVLATARQVRLDACLVRRDSVAAPSSNGKGGGSRRKRRREGPTERRTMSARQNGAMLKR